MGSFSFFMVVQLYNYVYAGEESEIAAFETFLQQRFDVGALDRT